MGLDPEQERGEQGRTQSSQGDAVGPDAGLHPHPPIIHDEHFASIIIKLERVCKPKSIKIEKKCSEYFIGYIVNIDTIMV